MDPLKTLTAHMIVRNEENFVWYAIMSVIDYIDKIIIFDNESKDKTKEIIQTIKNPKIVFEEKTGSVEKLRQEQLERTETKWFMLIDGDEVYPKDTIQSLVEVVKNAEEEKMAIVLRTRNCVGDISHFMPEDTGKYFIFGKTGHFNIRAFRKFGSYKWSGEYPLEAYVDENGNSVNKQDKKLSMLDKYYWHLTHLRRSSLGQNETPKRKGKLKEEIGVSFKILKIPEVFFLERPPNVPPPPFSVNKITLLKSLVKTPLKSLKRKFL